MTNNTATRCEFCHKEQNPKRPFYDTLFDDLWTQTPRSVWEEYRANGYTDHEAIKMGRTYA